MKSNAHLMSRRAQALTTELLLKYLKIRTFKQISKLSIIGEFLHMAERQLENIRTLSLVSEKQKQSCNWCVRLLIAFLVPFHCQDSF